MTGMALPRNPSVQARDLRPAALVMLAWTVAHFVRPGTPVFPVDDAYITLHNARVLLGTPDANFGVPALVGATSTLHVVLVALLGLVLPLPWAMDTTLWGGVLLYATGVHRLAEMAGARPVPALMFMGAAMLAGYTVFHLLNGLETGLAMGVVAWALVAVTTRGQRAAVILAALCGLLPFVRPELAVLSALLLPLSVMQAPREERLRLLIKCVAVALLSALPWLLFHLWNTGELVPATAAAKEAWFAEKDNPTAWKTDHIVGELLRFLISFGAIASIAVMLMWRSRVGIVGACFAGALVAAFWINLPGGFAHSRQRYLFVLAPVLVFAATMVFRLVTAKRHSLIACILLAQSALFAGPAIYDLQTETASTEQELGGVADWCNANLPTDSVLLIHDAGYIAWATQFRMVDLVGLKTPSSIAPHQQLTLPSGGTRRAEAMASIARNAHASHLVVLETWDDAFSITSGLRSQGMLLEPLRRGGAYKVYRLTELGASKTDSGS
jgi:hypothetical protein